MITISVVITSTISNCTECLKTVHFDSDIETEYWKIGYAKQLKELVKLNSKTYSFYFLEDDGVQSKLSLISNYIK